MAESVIQTDDLSIKYVPRTFNAAVSGLTFSLRPRTMLAITGPTGSGKSALLEILSAQRKSQTSARIAGGKATVLGRDVSKVFWRSRYRLQANVGYLKQNAAMQLSAQFTVAENISLPITSRDKRWDRSDLVQRVYGLLDELGLPEAIASKYPHELSSGQRQRVALAKAVVLEPEILLLDDPTRGVDPIARESVVRFLISRKEQADMSVLLVTANPTLIFDVVDEILVLDDGQTAEYGSRESLLRNPQSNFLTDFQRLFQTNNSH